MWRAVPHAIPALSAEQPAPVPPPAGEPVINVPPSEAAPGEPSAGTAQPADRVEPVLTAAEPDVDASPEDEGAGADGLTEEQREKLAAVGQQKPRSRFLIKTLIVFIVVVGSLLLAQKMFPLQGLDKSGMRDDPPADVGEVNANSVPADPEKGGHIVGDELPAQ